MGDGKSSSNVPASEVADLGSTLAALSLSPDGKHSVVAGRDVLKIIEVRVDERKLKVVRNMRPGRKGFFFFFCFDLS